MVNLDWSGYLILLETLSLEVMQHKHFDIGFGIDLNSKISHGFAVPFNFQMIILLSDPHH